MQFWFKAAPVIVSLMLYIVTNFRRFNEVNKYVDMKDGHELSN